MTSATRTEHARAAERTIDPGLSGWTDGLLVVVAIAYAAFIGFLTVTRGVELTPDVAVVAIGFAVVLAARNRIVFLRDWMPFLLLFLAYELMRGLADNVGLPVHVEDVIGVERALFGGQLPTAILQAWLRPESGTDWLATVGTIVYLLHFPLPIVTGLLLWRRRRDLFHPYLAALILVSFAGFVTFLLLPVAPPWWAAEHGRLGGLPGDPGVVYLKENGLVTIAAALGLPGHALFDIAFTSINANPVAAFPSLHAAYPFISFLALRRAFGRPAWLVFAYGAFVALTIVYTADHYVIDVLAGVAYATAAYLLMWWLIGRRRAGAIGPG